MNLYKIVFVSLLLPICVIGQSNIIRDGNSLYLADKVIVKYTNFNVELNKSENALFDKFGIQSISLPILKKSINNKDSELNNIVILEFSSPYNPIYISKELARLSNIEWVEPYYLYETTFVPNDPFYNHSDSLRSAHLKLINSEEAWDINQGNEDIIIAIIDTGVDWNHPDLAANIWTNSNEIANNGIDDDNNGFVDDVRGWDFGGLTGIPDNDPSEDRPDHGTHVAGLASAVTNNGIGISSIGFKSTLMPVKTSRNDVRNDLGTALISNGYQGIIYAADNGANIINCSWGGYNYSNFAQSVIDYAISKGALVVAAAGNDNSTDDFYPASYNGVLSVGGTSFVDQKASWSNYGNSIDVTAPGVNIFSTWQNDNLYRNQSGTSLSSPITAGLAALVADQFPEYSPLQIAEQIRVTSDNLNTINPGFINQLGFGRINAEKALSTLDSKSVRISNLQTIEVGNSNDILESGENVKFLFELTNYLSSTGNLQINLTTTDPNVEIINGSASVSQLNTLEQRNLDADLFEIFIRPNTPLNTDINFLVTFSDNDYSDFQWIKISVNPTYQNHRTENLSITFNSSGSIGFDDYPTNKKGNGFIYMDNSNLMFEGALIYGTSENSIVNSARNVDGDKDNDFSNIIPISLKSPGPFSDILTYTKFSDQNAVPRSLGVDTEVYTLSFNSSEDAHYILMRYRFENISEEIIDNFYAGQFWDFDLDDTSYDDDLVGYNEIENFAFIKDDDGNPVNTHIGLKILNNDEFNLFAMDNDGSSNPTIAWDGFSDSEKWTALTNGSTYSSSGPSDISLVISDGPFTIEPDSIINLDIAIVAASSEEELLSNLVRAKEKYLTVEFSDSLNTSFNLSLFDNYPNPFNSSTTIQYSIPTSESSNNLDNPDVKLEVYNILGEKVQTLVNGSQSPGEYFSIFDGNGYASGIYFYQLQIGSDSITKKMILMK